MKNEKELIKKLDLGISKVKESSMKMDNLVKNIKANIAHEEMKKLNIKNSAKEQLKDLVKKEL